MAKRTSPEQRRWVGLVKKWQANFWLLDWDFVIETEWTKAPKTKGIGGYGIHGEATPLPRYREAKIVQYAKNTAGVEDGSLNDTACHEVAHVFLSKVDTFVEEHLMPQLTKDARKLANSVWQELKEETTTRLTSAMTRMERLR